MTPARWRTGNAAEDGADYRGWILGHFIAPASDVRCTHEVEVTWGVHAADERRVQWACDEQRTTLVLLIQGQFRIDLAGENGVDNVVLTGQGEYLLWGPEGAHRWHAEQASTVLTLRWPSLPSSQSAQQ